MAYNLSAFAGAGAQFFDNNGGILSGGLLYVYTAGTTTPVTTWTSNSGAAANTNPIVLDSTGRTPYEIWLNSGVTYKFVLKTSTGTLLGTYDNIPAIDDPTVFNNLITVAGTNTLIGTSTPPYTAYVAGMTISFVATNTNTGAVTIDVDGLGAKNIYTGSAAPLSGGEIVAGRMIQLEYDGTRFQMQVLSLIDGSVTTAKLADGSVTLVKINSAVYGTTGASKLLQLTSNNAIDTSVVSSKIQPITASVAANALTLTLNPTVLDFRSSTLASGTVNTRVVGSAISVVVPNTATLGTVNGAAARLTVLAIDNAGTVELAVVNNGSAATTLSLDETTLINTTTVSASATSAGVVYSTTGRTGVPFRVVGFIDITEATAGTWATAPTTVQGIGGNNVTAVSPQTCKAWVNFNGVTTATIRASYNVSSVTRNSTGLYTLNFTNALSDANYSFAGSAMDNGTSNTITVSTYTGATYTTSALQIQTLNGTARTDFAVANVAVFR